VACVSIHHERLNRPKIVPHRLDVSRAWRANSLRDRAFLDGHFLRGRVEIQDDHAPSGSLRSDFWRVSLFRYEFYCLAALRRPARAGGIAYARVADQCRARVAVLHWTTDFTFGADNAATSARGSRERVTDLENGLKPNRVPRRVKVSSSSVRRDSLAIGFGERFTFGDPRKGASAGGAGGFPPRTWRNRRRAFVP
jgi:hypothetical protein